MDEPDPGSDAVGTTSEEDVGSGRSSHYSFSPGHVLGDGGHVGSTVRVCCHPIHSFNDPFLEELPDAFDLVSRALSAGHGFSEALHMVSEEMPDPIATEFRKAYEEQNLGLSIKLALENLTQRIPLLDLRMCVTAVLIQRETGGNLSEILEKVSHTIRERFRIMGDLKTLTTSSRMSAWLLCGLPIFVALAVTVMNPDYMSVLWKDHRGHYLIAAAMFMQISGMLIVRKILNIKI